MSGLREALGWWSYDDGAEWVKSAPEAVVGHVSVAMDAARRFLALTETGIRVAWCEPHEALANPIADYCGKSLYLSDAGLPDSTIGPCRIVPKLLADYLDTSQNPDSSQNREVWEAPNQEHLRGLCATHPERLGVYHGTGEDCVPADYLTEEP